MKSKSGLMQYAGTAGALLILCVVIAVLSPNFLKFDNLMAVLKQTSFNALLAIGMLLALITLLIILIAVIQYLFKYTRFGNYVRGIGENELAIRFTGANVNLVKIAVFIISGVLFAIAGIFTIARQGGTSSTIGSGFEMKVMMALFIGGIPVQGGEGTKVYKLIFGSFTITLLEISLVLLNAQSAVVQLIKGIILLGAVYLTNLLARKLAYVGTAESANQKLVEEAAEK